MSESRTIATAVFVATLALTFLAAYLGRRHSAGRGHDGLADEKLNRWLIGLSAGAAANSGFVVTGAVGLGYLGGAQFLLLPLGWLVGDILFWSVFPGRINDFGRVSRATTLSQVLTHGLPRGGAALALLCSLVVVLCLGGYLSAQWLAGQKFLAGAFGASNLAALASFALLIVIYTSIGGFRGSVYVDSMQAVIRLIGTTLALAAVIVFANQRPEQVQAEWGLAGADYLNLMGQGGIGGAAGIIVGFAAAALGFGLGQPQLVSRYLAGSDAKETRAAWWIYIGFVQFTWAAMTLFGIYLRGVMPGLADPETGLSAFFEAHVHPVLTGIIIADIFATIAATSNALLVAMGQAVAHDLGARLSGRAWPLGLTCVLMGLATMGVSLVSTESVVSMALTSVSLLGAGLAPAMMAKVLGWRHTGASLIVAVLAGLAAAIAWRLWGASNLLNEAAIGIPVGVAANFLAASLASGAGASRVAKPPGHS